MSYTEYKTSIINSIDLSGFNLNYEGVTYKVKSGKIEQSVKAQIFTEASLSRLVERANEFILYLTDSTILNLTSISNIKLEKDKDAYIGIITYSDSNGVVKGIIV